MTWKVYANLVKVNSARVDLDRALVFVAPLQGGFQFCLQGAVRSAHASWGARKGSPRLDRADSRDIHGNDEARLEFAKGSVGSPCHGEKRNRARARAPERYGTEIRNSEITGRRQDPPPLTW